MTTETKTEEETPVKKAPKAESKATPKVEKTSDKMAVIKTGGKQYLVTEGQILKIEKLPAEEVSEKGEITFNDVLMVVDGEKFSLGTPVLEAKVKAELIESGRGKKISVIRFRSKSRYFKKYGHRQPFMQIQILKIG